MGLTSVFARPAKESMWQYLWRGVANNALIPAVVVGGIYGGSVVSNPDFTTEGMFDYSDTVTPSVGVKPGNFNKDFNCRASVQRCEMDLGQGISVTFAQHKDYINVRNFVDTKMPKSFKGKSIPDDMNMAFMLGEMLTPYPYEVWMRFSYAENLFRKDVMNPDTNARGAFQMVPNTALEELYLLNKSGKYASIIPEASEVKREKKDGKYIYSVANQDAYLDSVLNNPIKSIILASQYLNRSSERLAPVVGKEINSLHMYSAWLQGTGGAEKLWSAYAEDRDAPAFSMHEGGKKHKAVKYNEHLYYSDGQPLTLKDMLDKISNEKGIGKVSIGALDDIKRWMPPQIELTIKTGSPELVKLPSKAPIPASRPSRPSTPSA